jgi:flap endonuclease-1
MGVPLQPLITAKPAPMEMIAGSKLAVDGMNVLYQLLFNPFHAQQAEMVTNRVGKPISHLYGWLQKVLHWQQLGVLPVVVFDGKADALKHAESRDRAREIQYLQKKYDRALAIGDKSQAKQYATHGPLFWYNCVEESKHVLTACGVPILNAPSEAEAQCAQLQKTGLVDFVLSNDFDVLLFGAKKSIRKMTFAGREQVNGQWKTMKPNLEILDLPAILSELGITYYQLIDLGIIIGNDFFPGIPTIGPKKGLEAIKYHGSLDTMLTRHPNLLKLLPPAKLNYLRMLFLTPVVHECTELPNRPRPDLTYLQDYLTKTHFLNPDRVDKLIKKLAAPPKRRSVQMRLDFRV